MPKNMFADVDDTRQLIYQLVGLSSVCWVDKPTGVYDSMLACKAAEDVLTRFNELKRDELVDFAVWLLQDEPGAGKEDKLVDNYLMKNSGAPNCRAEDEAQR